MEFYLDTKNPSFSRSLKFCRQVARSDANILIIGESGTGKEAAARYIHACSKCSHQKFVAVNCSAYTETLLESELFGHEQGSFTGALKTRTGKFELADNGTLFLDEIGDLNLSTQVKLLRTLETKMIERVGSNESKKINFRLITATNRDLLEAIRSNQFREDFFYRISTIVIQIPPLRERKEDLEDLIHFFLKDIQEENNTTITEFEPGVWNFLMSYDYPGNIRELKNIVARMVVLSKNGVITKETLPLLYDIYHRQASPSASQFAFSSLVPWRDFKAQSEKAYLEWVLSKTGGNVSQAARQLEISSRQVFNKIREYGIKT